MYLQSLLHCKLMKSVSRFQKVLAKKSFLTVAIELLAAIGLTIQLQAVTSTYFKYETKAETKISRDKVVPVPSVSLCWNFLDLINLEEVKKKSGKTFEPPFSKEEKDEIVSTVTVKNIFEWTPPDMDITESCFIRNGNSFSSKILVGKDCDQEFRVDKFYHREFICYHFQVTNFTTYSLYQTLYTSNKPGIFFEIDLKHDVFSKGSFYSPTVHSPRTSALFDISLSYYFHRTVNDSTGEHEPEKIHNSFFTIDTIRLPPPYDTNCFASNITNTDKILSCLDEHSMKKLGKVSGSQIVRTPEEKFILNSQELEKFGEELDSFLKVCRKSISQLACERYHTSTETQVSESDKLTLSVEWPKNPDFIIISYAKMSFLELVIYQMSSVGIWFGISFLSVSLFIVNKARQVIQMRRSDGDLKRHKDDRELHARKLLQQHFARTHRVERELRDLRLFVLNHSLHSLF